MISVLLLLIVLQTGPVSNQTSTPTQPQITSIKQGDSFDRQLSAGTEDKYEFVLTKDQYASFTVEHRGIDVTTRILNPDGSLFLEFDEELRADGQETPHLVAPSDGRYSIVVAAKAQKGKTGSYTIRFAGLHSANEQERTLQEARQQFLESFRLWRSGKYDAALPLASRALDLRESVLGPEHPLVATALNNLGVIHYLKGNLDTAESLDRRALAIREKAFGSNHPLVASMLNNIAEIYRLRANYAEADSLYRRAIASWENSLGPDHYALAFPLTNLAIVRRRLGDYTEAEQLYKRGLVIRETVLGPEHADVALNLNNLGALYMTKGDYDNAASHLQRAVAIWEKNFGPDYVSIGAALQNLATIQHENGNTADAVKIYRRALAIYEKALGPDHANVAAALNQLGNVLMDQNELIMAEPMLLRSLTIREKVLGPDHPDVGESLVTLAKLYFRKGDYLKADSLYERSLKILEGALGPENPQVAQVLTQMSALYVKRNNSQAAIKAQYRANAIIERHLALNLATGSERQKFAYLRKLSDELNRTIALHVRTAPETADAQTLALTTIVRFKGRVQEAMSDSLSGLRRRLDPQDQALLDQLNETMARLSRLVLGPREMPPVAHQRQVTLLEKQREQLENQISERTAGAYRKPEPVTLEAIRAVLPIDAALIELSTYRPLLTNSGGVESYGEPYYVAYVLRKNGEIGWKELGQVKDIDAIVSKLREALRNPKRSDVNTLARNAGAKLITPLQKLLGDAKHLFVSADGELNLLPFAALKDEQNRYLIEPYSFTYLTSGRDLLRMQGSKATASKPVVIADPNFGEVNELATVSKRQRGSATRRSVTNTRELSDVYFAPLAGTELEARAIKTFFPEASLLTGSKATETAVKKVASPQVLHLATHGFFLDDSPENNAPVQTGTRGINANVHIENPLLRSGLALAGANKRSADGDDGILTALEASGLNLWGTKLVVLSACDTGVGEVRNGEGVYGLRRAFVLAGAESLVMSLWPASDYTTRKLMTDYYKNLKQGMGRGDSLRQVQLNMLKRDPHLHPFYWANFIQAGDWSSLDGRP